MSNLNEKIGMWRASIEGRLGPRAADELEDHLRSTIESLKSTGLADEERLLLASHRLGSAAQLSNEFDKMDRAGVWRERAVWILVGFVPLPLLSTAFRDAAGKIGSALFMRGLPAWGAAAISLVLPALAVLALFLIGRFLAPAISRLNLRSMGRLPTSFAKLAALLAFAFVAIQLFPGVVSLLYRAQGVPIASASDFNRFVWLYAVVRELSSVGSSIAFAVLLAWLVTKPQAERGSVSTGIAE